MYTADENQIKGINVEFMLWLDNWTFFSNRPLETQLKIDITLLNRWPLMRFYWDGRFYQNYVELEFRWTFKLRFLWVIFSLKLQKPWGISIFKYYLSSKLCGFFIHINKSYNLPNKYFNGDTSSFLAVETTEEILIYSLSVIIYWDNCCDSPYQLCNCCNFMGF